ncbi:hypothetical protein GCM10008961_17010 [Deinococcus knuensis]|uniref:Glycosyl transferase family 1 domain-containing protein n=2 Tax=Deinococcus knuensis TaxID=1837380 RepID=A0ABQ2SIL9_9DEIO|nr:hypothetical protein GCM10008961_17010 [Deinococcus knuensis]
MLYTSSFLKSVLDRLIIGRVLSSAEAVFALHETEKKYLKSRFSLSNIELLPNGIEIKNKELSDIQDRNEKIIFLARLSPRKRVDLFLESAKILLAEGEYQFEIYGPDGGDADYVNEFIANNGLGHSIKYFGEVSNNDSLKIFQNSKIYVLPSDNEPFPMSLLEALSCGIPSIITDSNQISDLVMEKESALVCRGAPVEIADAIRYLSKNDSARKKISENGRMLIRDKLSADIVTSKLVSAYGVKQ